MSVATSSIPIFFNKCMHLLFYRSGTEENYDELAQLLEDISTYLDDMQFIKDQTSKKRNVKESKDRIKGLQIRAAAMETYSK